MKGSIGTPTQITYVFPKLSKLAYKTAIYEKLSDKAKFRLRLIELYQIKELSIKKICQIFEIYRSTFWRWRSCINSASIIISADQIRVYHIKFPIDCY